MISEEDKQWMTLARDISKKSTCSSVLAVGAVLVGQGQIISSAANGTVDNSPTCDEVGCNFENDKPRHIHAEEQVIINCAVDTDKSTRRSTLYVTHSPCCRCILRLAQSKVERIVYDHLTADFLLTRNLAHYFNIDFERISDE